MQLRSLLSIELFHLIPGDGKITKYSLKWLIFSGEFKLNFGFLNHIIYYISNVSKVTHNYRTKKIRNNDNFTIIKHAKQKTKQIQNRAKIQ